MSAAAAPLMVARPAAHAVPCPGAPPAPPAHVAVIMDGNGRWASARGLPRVAGHREGTRAVRRTIEAAMEAGVGWLTLYAFSSENWRRPATEVLGLTTLLRQYLKSEVAELHQNGVRLRIIGERDRFDADIRRSIDVAEGTTRDNTKLNLVIALSYGARSEIAAAARACAEAVRSGAIDPHAITEDSFTRYLATDGIPDPDLIIRTSGERRLSNFLLWQAAYAELVFQDVLWPDFTAAHFASALADYAGRERRFGARAV